MEYFVAVLYQQVQNKKYNKEKQDNLWFYCDRGVTEKNLLPASGLISKE